MTPTQVRILAVLGALVALLGIFTAVVFALDPGGGDGQAAEQMLPVSPTARLVPLTPSPTGTRGPATPTGTATATPTPSPTATPVRGPLVVRAPGAVNVRGGPGTEFSIVTTLTAGEELAASGRNADSTWLLVTQGTGTGWVAADVVQVVSGAPSALPVVPTPAIPRTAVPTATPEPPTPVPTRPPATVAPATPAPTVRPTTAPMTAPTRTATPAPTIGVAPTFVPATVTATAEP